MRPLCLKSLTDTTVTRQISNVLHLPCRHLCHMPGQHIPNEARPALVSMSTLTLSNIPLRFPHRWTRLQTCELALRTSQLTDLVHLASPFTSRVFPPALFAVDILLEDCVVGAE